VSGRLTPSTCPFWRLSWVFPLDNGGACLHNHHHDKHGEQYVLLSDDVEAAGLVGVAGLSGSATQSS
jgi:hypothetical protein